MSDRTYDVVLLGATGFTGGLVATHLTRRLAGTTTRWAIAGRSRDRLQAVVDGLPLATDHDAPAIEVVDIDDADTLRALAASTDALATTVGPYASYGEPVVAACVDAGTDYADITGEPAFVDRILDRYDEPARDVGIRLLSCCGFDSVPHDLGVALTVGQLPDDVPVTVRAYVEADASFSGGTARSAVQAIASRHLPSSRPRGAGVREVRPYPARLHRIPSNAGIDGYGVPLPTIDPAIVLRSAATGEGYGSKFRYGHFARVRKLPSVVAGIAGVGALAALSSLPPTVGWSTRRCPPRAKGRRRNVARAAGSR